MDVVCGGEDSLAVVIVALAVAEAFAAAVVFIDDVVIAEAKIGLRAPSSINSSSVKDDNLGSMKQSMCMS